MTRKATRLLLEWYAKAKRDLPWRRTGDPYRILLSEVMLQQTRVSAVTPYYERFLARYPDAAALAAAPEQDVLAAWSGLGYYARARHLRKAAQAIAARGSFPNKYAEIRALPGVGDYTAAAVASIAFGLPRAVVDGNVLRVLARTLGERGDIQATATRARIQAAADRLLDRARPAEFNQAVMELGATVCLPKGPLCLLCPWSGLCQARRLGLERELPVKSRGKETVYVERTLLLIRRMGCLALWQRGAGERKMAGFWELPEPEQVPRAKIGPAVGQFSHSITHHRFVIEVREASVGRLPESMVWKPMTDLERLPLSTLVRKALRSAYPSPASD